MSKPMRKTLELEVCGQAVDVDVNWRIIEVVERTFGTVADLVASDTLVHNPMRYKVAEVIAEWVRSRELRRKDVYEYVLKCRTEELQVYIGAIQGAVLYSLSYIEEKDFDKLTQGKDLDPDDGEGEKKEEKPAKKKSASRKGATKSQ